MSPLTIAVGVLLAIQSLTYSEGAGSISVSVTPVNVKEFTRYTIRCQYPTPVVNASSTGVLQVTHLSPSNDVIYSYDFEANDEVISSAIQKRSTAGLNKTTGMVVVEVQVALASDSGLYSCSLSSPSTNASIQATTATPLNVTGCVGGSQLDHIFGCPSVSVGSSCSIFCNSSIANATVSLSRYISGSPQILSAINEVNYTIGSVQNSDFGTYFCYVRTDSCLSMANATVADRVDPGNTNGSGCGDGGECDKGRRLPGWGIALIVIACIVVVIIIIIVVIFLLHKKGVFNRDKEPGVQTMSGGQGLAVANDNFAMSRARSDESQDKNRKGGKKAENGKSSSAAANSPAAVVSFPEVKTRKNQLPPLETTQGGNRRPTEQASPDVAKVRPLPKRASQDENASSPDAERRRRSSQFRRQPTVDDEASPERGGGWLPAIKSSPRRDRNREEEEEDEPDRF